MIVEDPRPRREEAAPLLLVHGFLGDPSDWDEVVAALPRPRRILRADLLAAARLEPESESGEVGVEDLSERCAEEIRRQGLAPLDVAGYSLGGRIVLDLAARHPVLVRRGIAVSASPGIDGAVERAERAAADARLAETLEREGMDRFLDRWYAQPLFTSLRTHPAFARIRARRAGGDAAAWARILREASPGRSAPRWEALDRLAEGLSLVVGELDAKYRAQSAEAARRSPALRVDVIEGAGHAIHLERPEPLAALFGLLLDGIPDDPHRPPLRCRP